MSLARLNVEVHRILHSN